MTMNFEAAMNELETLIHKMETGQLSLEESLQCFEQGIQLARQCQTSLKEAEQKVQILIQKENDTLALEPFDLDTET